MGSNAIVEISHQIAQFYSLNGWRGGLTINPGTIRGGLAVSAMPEDVEVLFDLRFLCHEDRQATEAEWRKMMTDRKVPGVELRLSMLPEVKEPMVCTDASRKLIYQAQELACTLGFTLGHELTGGAGDAGYASLASVPVLDGLGPIGGGDHSLHEYLRLDSVAPRSALLAGLIASVAIGKEKEHR